MSDDWVDPAEPHWRLYWTLSGKATVINVQDLDYADYDVEGWLNDKRYPTREDALVALRTELELSVGRRSVELAETRSRVDELELEVSDLVRQLRHLR